MTSSTLRFWHPLLVWGGIFCVVAGSLIRVRTDDLFALCSLVYPGILLLITGAVFGHVLLYRSWRCLARHVPHFDSERQPLDPGAAVALTAIPGVNLVGIFFSLAPLPIQLNWLANEARVPQRANKDLGLATAVMILTGFIPVLGIILAGVAGLILLPRLLCSCSEVADAIEERLIPAWASVATGG